MSNVLQRNRISLGLFLISYIYFLGYKKYSIFKMLEEVPLNIYCISSAIEMEMEVPQKIPIYMFSAPLSYNGLGQTPAWGGGVQRKCSISSVIFVRLAWQGGSTTINMAAFSKYLLY